VPVAATVAPKRSVHADIDDPRSSSTAIVKPSAPGGLNRDLHPLQKRAPMHAPTERTQTVGHISQDAQVRVDQRVKEILDRREAPVARDAAVEQARRAARNLNGG